MSLCLVTDCATHYSQGPSSRHCWPANWLKETITKAALPIKHLWFHFYHISTKNILNKKTISCWCLIWHAANIVVFSFRCNSPKCVLEDLNTWQWSWTFHPPHLCTMRHWWQLWVCHTHSISSWDDNKTNTETNRSSRAKNMPISTWWHVSREESPPTRHTQAQCRVTLTKLNHPCIQSFK